MIEETPNEQLDRYQVHSRNEKYFLNHDFGDRLAGDICTCGHPAFLHGSYCKLLDACGCERLTVATYAHDIRPFFQITHGPMEAHALGRGLRLSRDLGVDVEESLTCSNWCKNYLSIGACRHGMTGSSIQVKKRDRERHVLYCNRCFEHLCLP